MERLMEPELLATQRVARELEGERDAALAREAVLREVAGRLERGLYSWSHGQRYRNLQVDILAKAADRVLAALATPSPAADALRELARAAEADVIWFERETDRPVRVEEMTPTYEVLYLAVEKWRRARRHESSWGGGRAR